MTSKNGRQWETEAKYEYYLHGPLARTVFGQQQVQGMDYAYTLQGWLKGVNSTGSTSTHDTREDGKIGSLNQYVGRDALGFNLNYYGGDYKAINAGVNPFPAYYKLGGTAGIPDSVYRPLYNGNIQRYSRYREGGDNFMDSLTYKYYAGSNKLRQVRDSISANKFGGSNQLIQDIDDQTDTSNYVYDEIGNLIQDKAESSTAIKWNVYGKITEITRTTGPGNPYTKIAYTYDAQGNRISKVSTNNTSGNNEYTWYVRDAQGNLMSTYTATASSSLQPSNLQDALLNHTDRYIYGSSRLGVFMVGGLVDNSNTGPGELEFFSLKSDERGYRQYELTNHLGNVLSTISDKKFGVYSGSSLTIPGGGTAQAASYYNVDIISANDYYPFGMPSRISLATNSKYYKFGFNGKENDYEAKGWMNQQDYGMRIYDTRLGRFLSVDPIAVEYPWYSPYQFAGNKPIWATDLDGLEENTASTYVRPPRVPVLAKPTFKGIISITDAWTRKETNKLFQGKYAELKKADDIGASQAIVNRLAGDHVNGMSLNITLVDQKQQVKKNWERTTVEWYYKYTYSLESMNEDGDLEIESGTFEYNYGSSNQTSAYDIVASIILGKITSSISARIVNGSSLVKSVEFTKRESIKGNGQLSRLLRWENVVGSDFTKAASATKKFTERLGARAIKELKELGYTKEDFLKWKKTYEDVIKQYAIKNKNTEVQNARLESINTILKLWTP